MMMRTIQLALLLTVLLIGSDLRAQDIPAYVPKGFSLQWQPDFKDKKLLTQLEITDARAWRLSDSKGKSALELIGGSRYRYKVESPQSIALLPTQKFGDFLLEAELIQTGREYGHRDLCLFFGFQDPGHFYYAHFASKTDPRANQIFIVNEKPFTKISLKTTEGSKWGQDKWRKVRVQRIGSKITVWFDDMKTPAMLADDKTFGAGFLGFGSYNDTGMFANVRVWAPASEEVERKAIFPTKTKP